MGSMEPFGEDQSWEEKVKCLPDEDLVEMWAETQEIEQALNLQAPGHNFPAASFEQAIVHELLLRATQKLSHPQG